jgi:hypothetical protein
MKHREEILWRQSLTAEEKDRSDKEYNQGCSSGEGVLDSWRMKRETATSWRHCPLKLRVERKMEMTAADVRTIEWLNWRARPSCALFRCCLVYSQ